MFRTRFMGLANGRIDIDYIKKSLQIYYPLIHTLKLQELLATISFKFLLVAVV
jgi:hypothetical protein